MMKRIEYIDSLRGFTMLLVVFWHVSSMGFGLSSSNSVLNNFFLSFRMPMFFFISGFIGYKSIAEFTPKQYVKLLKRKSFCQLVPTAIFFSIFAFIYGNGPLSFFSKGLEGYWFTLVLFELFLIYYTLSFLFGKSGSKYREKGLDLTMVILAIVGNVLALIMNVDLTRVPKICIVLTLNNLCYYMQFFFFGILCRKYEQVFHKLLENKYLVTFILTGFVLLFISINTIFTHDFNRVVYYMLSSIVIKYFGLISLFLVFYSLQSLFSSTTKIGQISQFIGKRTLDIYLLHYFFIPDMTRFADLLIFPKENVVMELFVVGGMAIAVIGLCLIVSRVLRMSPILAKYLFGVFPKNTAK